MQNKKFNRDNSYPEPERAHVHNHSEGHSARCTDELSPDGGGRLWAIFVLTAGFMLAEAFGGWLTGSIALLADAGHMAVDALALGLALLASRLSRRPATAEKTFGYFRFEPLAAFINASTLMIISISIFYEASERLFYPVPVESNGMIIIAAGGLIINLLSIWILHGQHNHDLNSHGAWLHLLGDTLGSVGAILAGIFMSVFGWFQMDPLVSIAIGTLIVYGSWGLIKKAVHILLEGAPPHLSFAMVEQSILETNGVHEVHDLHLWAIASGKEALSCHVVHQNSVSPHKLLNELQERLRRQFGIHHLTLQMEAEVSPGTKKQFCNAHNLGCFNSKRD